MRFPTRRAFLITVLSLTAVTLTQTVAQNPSHDSSVAAGKRWWKHIEFLADDKLEGRNVGSPGYQTAADYVAARFKEYGLVPAGAAVGADGKGAASYFQPVKFDVQRLIAGQTSVKLMRDGQTTALSTEEMLVGAGSPQPRHVSAPLVFIGYGLQIPEADFDDFKGQDLKGKIVVYLNGGPADISGPLKSNARSGQEFWKAMEAAGAVGRITIANPKSMDIPWVRSVANATGTGMWLSDPAYQDVKSPMFTASFNPAHADMLLAGTGHTMAELLALADEGKPLPRFPIPATLEAQVTTEITHVDSMNVVGLLPGTDRKLKSEYVILSAHLDHVGKRPPRPNDASADLIYNGAMDDASGIATILEVARNLRDSRTKLKRSVVFLAVTAEEKGLLGSRYYSGNPTVPKASIVADLNLDMFLPIHPLRLLTIQGLEESTLGDDIRKTAAKMNIGVQKDPEPDRNAFIRSDQYSFIRTGVPALAFKFGFTVGSPEEKLHKDWRTQRYHAPSDDLQQPIDLEGAGRFNLLLTDLTATVANNPQRPRWNESSFFKRFAKKD